MLINVMLINKKTCVMKGLVILNPTHNLMMQVSCLITVLMMTKGGLFSTKKIIIIVIVIYETEIFTKGDIVILNTY